MRPASATLLFGALALAGCNQLFGLHDVINVDAPDPYMGCSRPGDPTYHDEDGDGLPDDCDNCPGIANPMQEDTLEMASGQAADGVGDVCDPSPATTGDKIARFISFSGASDMALLEPHAGGWSIVNGELGIDSVGTDAFSELSFALTSPAKPYAVDAHYVYDSIGNAMLITYGTGLWANFVPTAGLDGRAECELEHHWNGTTHEDQVTAFIDGTSGIGQVLGGAHLVNGSGYLARAVLRDNGLDCQFFGDQGDTAAMSNVGPTITGKVGLEVQRVAVRFQYVTIYDMSGEPP